MGIFNIFKMFKGGRALNKLSYAVEEVLLCYDSYVFFNRNVKDLYKAAFLIKCGIFNNIDKWHWGMNTLVYIHNYPELGRITIAQIMDITMGRLAHFTEHLSSSEREYLSDILEGKDAYFEIEKTISQSKVEKILP